MKRVITILLLIFIAFFCLSCSGSRTERLPPGVKEKVVALNKAIKQMENDLKFMVLEKDRAKGGKRVRLIKKQQKLKGKLKRAINKRERIFKRYLK